MAYPTVTLPWRNGEVLLLTVTPAEAVEGMGLKAVKLRGQRGWGVGWEGDAQMPGHHRGPLDTQTRNQNGCGKKNAACRSHPLNPSMAQVSWAKLWSHPL